MTGTTKRAKDDLAALMRIAFTLIGERALLEAMATWPKGSNGVLAIGAYENLTARLLARLRADSSGPSGSPAPEGGE